MLVEEWADAPAAVRLDGLAAVDLRGAAMTFKSGAAAGRVLYVVDSLDDLVLIGYGAGGSEGLTDVAAGDVVELDNSVYLAAQTYTTGTWWTRTTPTGTTSTSAAGPCTRSARCTPAPGRRPRPVARAR